ncbi:MAG: hypothetical protein DLM58_08775 [Pseudonocardiales bacterium]|nr:MAG: hypothetical protein DLM58_08775 [Pseudonocardiales bacterium]
MTASGTACGDGFGAHRTRDLELVLASGPSAGTSNATTASASISTRAPGTNEAGDLHERTRWRRIADELVSRGSDVVEIGEIRAVEAQP